MAKGTPIGWLHRPGYTPYTLNIVVGCTPVSDGCKLCFAPNSMARQEHLPGRDGITTRDEHGRRAWTGKVALLEERLDWPRRLRNPHMIFVTVLGDLFNAKVPEEFIARVWQMMADTPQHIYVILTKQPKRMRDIVTRLAERFGVLANVHLGVSVEDQEQADIRIPFLLDTPAAIRAVSCEPLLGPIDLSRWLGERLASQAVAEVAAAHGIDSDRYRRRLRHYFEDRARPALSWVIVGGESGPKAEVRPMHPQWARQIRDQAVLAEVAFFFKQHGSWGPAPWKVPVCDPEVGWQGTDAELAAAKRESERTGATHAYAVWAHLHGHQLYQPTHKPWSLERTFLAEREHAPMRFYPGKSAGDVLDGRQWHQWPDGQGGIIDAAPAPELIGAPA